MSNRPSNSVIDRDDELRELLVDRDAFYRRLGKIWRPPRDSIKIMTWGEAKSRHALDNVLVGFSPDRVLISRAIEKIMQREAGDETLCVMFRDMTLSWGYVSESDLAKTLKERRWRMRKTSINLLLDLQRLASEKTGLEYFQDFIVQWGPLWLCASHNWTDGSYIPCIWSPGRSLTSTKESHCTWAPVEPVVYYLRVANALDAVTRIAEKLRNEESVEPRLWRHLNLISPFIDYDRLAAWFRHWHRRVGTEEQKKILSSMLNGMLDVYDAGRLQFEWADRGFSLKFYTGWGFFRAALIELMGRRFGVDSIYRCDICGELILSSERERAPQKGKRVYCEECRSKRSRFSMRKTRQRECNARYGSTDRS